MKQKLLQQEDSPTLKLGRSKSSKSIVVIADTHTGFEQAVCTKFRWSNFIDKRNAYIASQLEEGWYWCIDQLKKKHSDLIILNGDAIDGQNRKEYGSGIWSTNIEQQIEDLDELFKAYTYSNIICTTGSGYHVKRYGVHDEQFLAQRLAQRETDGSVSDVLRNTVLPQRFKKIGGVTRDHTGRAVRWTDFRWDFDVNEHKFVVTHHVGGSSVPMYRATPLQKEMYNSALDAVKADEGGRRPSFVIRSHTHHYTQVRDGSTWGVITPCFKMGDEFLHSRGTGGVSPSIGTIEIILEQNGEREMYDYLLHGIHYPKRPIPNLGPLFWPKK